MIQLFVKENKNEPHRMTVRDTRGQILYLIKGRWGRKDDSITLSELDGSLILQAKQVRMSPFPIFELFDHQDKIGIIRKHPGLFGLRDSFFTIHPQKWVIAGDFEELYFTAHQNNQLIMECEKILKDDREMFLLYVEKEEDIPLSSLLTVILDHYARKKDEEEYYQELRQGDLDLGFLSHSNYSVLYSNKKHISTKTR